MKLGKYKVELEVEARNVWKSIEEGDQDRSYGGNTLRDIFLCSSYFSGFRCNFVPSQCNRVADALANYAKESQLEIWLVQALPSLTVSFC